MWSSRSRGFTMIEVLVAVLVLGLVVAASLKLTALAQQGLSEVRDKELLIDEATKMLIQLTEDPLNTFGRSGDLEWKVEDLEEQLWADDKLDINALNLDEEAKAQAEMFKQQMVRWRELEVKYKGDSVIMFLPYSEEAAAAASEDTGD